MDIKPSAPLTATRRDTLKAGAVALAGAVSGGLVASRAEADTKSAKAGKAAAGAALSVSLTVNGKAETLQLDPRTTLLDALRDHLKMTGTKKGCDHGQCGACTVIVDGRRINSCLTLAVMHEGETVTTIEGLGTPEKLDPMQTAFVEHDAFQCGYCTPGQICSATAVLDEIRQGIPSHVTPDLDAVAFSDAEVRERMSGNICRCAAYPNIVAAIRDVQQGDKA